MTLESKQLLNDEIITGAAILSAGRTLGLTDDETIDAKRATLRRDQRKKYEQRSRREANLDIMRDDERLAEIDAYEREFQRDKPIRAADLLAMGEYGMDEADLQQVTSGRIGNVKQVDAAGGSDGNRDERKFRSARRDVLSQKVGAWVQTPSGKSIYVAGENAPNQRVSPEMREATILQELGLASPPREEVPYQVNKKTGQKRRNFGRVVKDEDGQVIKEVLRRVKRPRQAGQSEIPDNVIELGKFSRIGSRAVETPGYPTAKRGSYRGIGEDGPQGIQRPVNAPSSALADAYKRLRSQVETGQVSPDALVEYPAGANGGSTARTVGEVLTRMEESLGGKAELGMLKNRASDLVIQDQRSLRDRARKQLRQIAVQAAAEGNPLTKDEAYALLERLQNPKEVSDIKAERVASEFRGKEYGSTREVIGENVMSDEAWKNTATKQIPQLPIREKADTISNAQVSQMVNADGVVVGHAAGGRFLGETNTPDTLQNLNVPSNQQNLISFISENLQYDNKGGLKPVIITEATEAFTDAASRLKGFGAGVRNIQTGIHSLGEAQFMMDRLIERRQAQPKGKDGFSRYNSENPGKPLKVPAGETPTVSDLMSTMRVDKATQGRLASALYQMGLSEGSDINQAGKQRYASREGSYQPVYAPEGFSRTVNLDDRKNLNPARQNITFDSPAGFFYDGADAAYIPNSQRARIDGENVYLQAALRGLDDPGAREPFIGQVAGEPAPKLRYRKGFGPGVSLEQGYEDLERSMVKGKRGYSQARVDSNIALARGVEARQAAHEERMHYDAMRKEANSLGADIELEAERRQDNRREARSRDKLLTSIASGDALPGRSSGDDGFRVAETPFRTEQEKRKWKKSVTPNQSDPMVDAMFRRSQIEASANADGERRPMQGPARQVVNLSSFSQPITEAPVQRSIAPDPWAETGPARPAAEPIQSSTKPQLALPYGVQTEGRVQGPHFPSMGPAPVRIREENNVRSFGSNSEVDEDVNRIRATRQRSGAATRGPVMSTGSRTGEQRRDQIINALTNTTGLNVRDIPGEFSKFAKTGKGSVNRFGRRSAAAGGAAVVLDTILNMGDNKEEEEEMVR